MDYLALNQITWGARADVHVDSSFYDVKGFSEMTECTSHEFIIEKHGHAIPLTYAVKARKL